MGFVKYRIGGAKNWNHFSESLHALSKYAINVSYFIEGEITANENRAEEIYNDLEKFPEEQYEYTDEIIEINHVFQMDHIYYDSLIFSSYSFLEKSMFYACKYLSENQNIKLNDMSGRGIEKYRTYLIKVCGLDLSKNDKEWEIIKQFNELRNYLIHSDENRILQFNNKKHKKILDFLKKSAYITIDEDTSKNIASFNITSTGFIISFHKTIHSFLHSIFVEEYKPTK